MPERQKAVRAASRAAVMTIHCGKPVIHPLPIAKSMLKILSGKAPQTTFAHSNVRAGNGATLTVQNAFPSRLIAGNRKRSERCYYKPLSAKLT